MADFSKLHNSLLNRLGKLITATPQGSEAKELKAVFSNKPMVKSPHDGVYVQGSKPVIKCLLADLPEGMAKGDSITIGSEAYKLARKPRADQNGWCILELNTA
jgi:hypothetical protein